MLELEDVQLQFESLRRQVKLGPRTFRSEPDLEVGLKVMEEYLRAILKEFEGLGLNHESPTVPLSNLPKLKAFLGIETRSTIHDGFAAPYDKVEAALLRLLT